MKKILLKKTTGEIVEKKSRFIGEAFPIKSPEEAMEIVAQVKKKYFDAKHHCFAYVCGPNGEASRYADDGEPQGTAGMPLLNLLNSRDLTDTLIVVTRYFGGILLGTGGLVRAYREAGEAALEGARYMSLIEGCKLILPVQFKDESNIRRIIKNWEEEGISISIESVNYSNLCFMDVIVEKDKVEDFKAILTNTFAGAITPKEDDLVMIYKEM